MKRVSWISEDNKPNLDKKVNQLAYLKDALEDGMIEASEVKTQEGILVDVMKDVEAILNDEQHAKVTTLLCELTAYNIMNLLQGLAAERVKSAGDQ